MFFNRHQRRHPEMYGITLYAPDGDDAPAGGGGPGTALQERPDVSEGDDADTGEDEGDSEGDTGDEAAEGRKAASQPVVKLSPEDQALIDSGRALGRHENETERQQKDRETAEAKAKTDRETALKALRTTRDTAIAEIRITSRDADGEEIQYKLPAPIEAQVTKIIADHDEQLEAHFGLGFRETQERHYVAAVPEADRAALQAELDKSTDHTQHAKAFGEAYAPHSDSIKNMDLEELVKLAPKANTQHKALLKAAKLESRLQGQDDTENLDGEPVIGGEPSGPAKTFSQLAVGYGAGTNSAAEDAQYLKRRSEREAAGGQ